MSDEIPKNDNPIVPPKPDAKRLNGQEFVKLLREIREQYLAEGGKPLSSEEIMALGGWDRPVRR